MTNKVTVKKYVNVGYNGAALAFREAESNNNQKSLLSRDRGCYCEFSQQLAVATWRSLYLN
ncbi:hypothetical protein H6G33_08865 [Calothrix sp. FACHB-1219]|uniref:hypothetical protein n=1 Tax=unclassified Calothrix TaxID=2619626 RepID=UPI0016822900|nr:MULTISPECIES: hypothetical protein [unclassified Calothrix]MBD2202107.1 hypothetical protein [Calothrix sp. FACHB-168]MBD2217141.1 hypothetical protein [Calothrix sp. FACHB-1219]